MPHILLAKPIICNLDVAVKRQQNVIQLEIPIEVKLELYIVQHKGAYR